MSDLVFGSVCSGIEAASVAWKPLGWPCAFMSEIEAFPRAVLTHHYPEAPLHGDFTTIRAGEYADISVLVGGTPCQSFSVAGLRGGLDDHRGNLALEYLRLADRLRPRWLVWENVPGVLSSNGGRDFGAILGGMVELGYGFAYRVLDAQFFGVAQRRRRVFVVGHLGDWRRAAAVLFERNSLSGNPPPSRKAGARVADPIAAGSQSSSGYRNDADTAHNLTPANVAPTMTGGAPFSRTGNSRVEVQALAYGGNDTRGAIDIATAISAHGGPHGGPHGRQDFESETFIAHTLRAEGFDASEDGTGRGTPLVPVAYRTTGNDGAYETGDQVGSLTTSTDPNAQIIAFSAKDHGADAMDDLSPTLRAGGHAGSHANAGVMPAIAFALRGRKGGAMPETHEGVSSLRAASGGSSRDYVAGSAVRRLTPRECERLQGFSDDYTAVPFRGKPAADGPRYKALGNSMAVPVMAWIGRRIALVDALSALSDAA